MDSKCKIPGCYNAERSGPYRGSFLCPECTAKEKNRKCATRNCYNEPMSAYQSHCTYCLSKMPGDLVTALESSEALSEKESLLDRITALEASVAILGKVAGEQEKTIENITSCLAGTIETIELLRKLGE